MRVEEGRSSFIIFQVNLQERDLWEGLNNIKMDLKEIVINTRNWDFWRHLENAALKLRVSWGMELVSK